VQRASSRHYTYPFHIGVEGARLRLPIDITRERFLQ
jgi:hypothetical protein